MQINQQKEMTYEDYKKGCAKFAESYGVTPSEHILNIMVSVCMDRDGLRHGGSFVKSIVANDLYEAITRADVECLSNIRIITLTKYNCYINF